MERPQASNYLDKWWWSARGSRHNGGGVMRVRMWFVLTAALTVVAVVAGPAHAGKGDTKGTAYQLASAIVTQGPVPLTDDAAAQPGDPVTYLGSEIRAGHVLNRVSGNERDELLLDIGGTKSGRYLGLDDTAAPSRTTVKCGVARVYFISYTTPHWYEALAVGDTTVGDGVLQCWDNSRMKDGWVIGYPNHETVGGAAIGECLTLTREGAKQWTVTADHSCQSARWSIVGGAVVQPAERGWGAAAPFTVTWNQK